MVIRVLVVSIFLSTSVKLFADTLFSGICQTNPSTNPISEDDTKYLNLIAEDLSESKSTDLKNIDDTVRYVNCYKPSREGEKLHKAFLKKYKNEIEKAASIVGMPPSFLICLFFRESSQWAMKKSAVGAEGIAQLMPATVSTLEGYINSGPYSAKNLKRVTDYLVTAKNRLKKEETAAKQFTQITDILQKYEKSPELDGEKLIEFRDVLKKLRDSIDDKTNASSGEISLLKDINSTLTFLGNNIESNRLRVIWEKYWGGKSNAPKTIDPMNTEQAVMAGALLLKKYQSEIEAASKSNKGVLPPTTIYTYLAAAYNGGVGRPGGGGFLGNCRPADGLAACLKIMKKRSGKENFNHMISIRNCMQKDSWDPMIGTEKDAKGCK